MSEPKANETKPKKMVRRSVAFALGIICIILISGLVGAFAYYHYTPIINDKDNTVSSLNAEISQLNSSLSILQEQVGADNLTINSLKANITNLQDQLNGLLNVTVITVGTITSNPSTWVDRTVIVEGSLGMVYFPVLEHAPWSYELSSGGQTIGVSLSANVNQSSLNNPASVRIYGVVEKGLITTTGDVPPPEVTYYIVALAVESL